MGLGGHHRVLLIGGEGVVLYAASGKGVDRETAIAWDVPNFDRQLNEILSEQNRSQSVLVLFDGADQAYRKEENIPKMSPFDRPRFVKRKLDLAFPNYPIRASLEVKPAKTKGRGAPKAPQSYLFAALPETDNLDRVGEALFESGVPVSGFGLLPIESSGLVSALAQALFEKTAKAGKVSRWKLLIGQHETGGLRQIVVKDGNLALSRLTPTSEAGTSGPGWVEEVVRGFKETLAYVSRLGFSPDEGLDVVIVCGDIEKQFFDKNAMPVTNFRCINISEALSLIGAKSFGLDKSNFADALHAAWAGKKRALALPVRVPSIHRVMAPRLGARFASVALALTALGLAGLTANEYSTWTGLKEELASKENQQQMMQRDYEQESKRFDVLPIRPEVIKNTLSIKSLLESNTVDPAPLLQKLRDTLGTDIYLKNMSFEHLTGQALKLGGSGGSGQPGGYIPPDAMQDKGKVKIKFSFTLPESVPLEQKVTRAETLEKNLRAAFPDWDVAITSQFGKVERGGAFAGAAGSAATATQSAEDYAQFEMEGKPL